MTIIPATNKELKAVVPDINNPCDPVAERWFRIHMPYRLQQLWCRRVRRLTCCKLFRVGHSDDPRSYTDRDISLCAFESGAVAARFLLEFLGIKLLQKSNGLNLAFQSHHGNDAAAHKLGGRFAQQFDLSDADTDLIVRFYNGVHVACAHLAFETNHDFDARELDPLVDLVTRLLHNCLYTQSIFQPDMLAGKNAAQTRFLRDRYTDYLVRYVRIPYVPTAPEEMQYQF